MRRFLLVLLLLTAVSFPASAFSPRSSYLHTVTAIAWQEDNTLHVALANPANTRTTVTISTPTVDVWGRPVFNSRRVVVPGRTIVQESFMPTTPRRGEELQVRVQEGYRPVEIEVQKHDLIAVDEYVVPADRAWEVSVDVSFLLESAGGTRLVFDDYYRTDDGYIRGAIQLTVVEGGVRRVRYSNAVEYVQPRVVLKMTTPDVTGLTTLTFDMRKTGGVYSWREEKIAGPTILVYGRNIRFAGGSADSSGTGRTSR